MSPHVCPGRHCIPEPGGGRVSEEDLRSTQAQAGWEKMRPPLPSPQPGEPLAPTCSWSSASLGSSGWRSSRTWAPVRRARCLGSSGQLGGSPCRAQGGNAGDSAPGLASGWNEAQLVRGGQGHLRAYTQTLYPQRPPPEQSLRLTSQARSGTTEHLHPSPPLRGSG